MGRPAAFQRSRWNGPSDQARRDRRIYLWGIVAFVVLVIAWFAALFTKRLPGGLHNFLAGYLRYQVHLFGYVTLAADPYPALNGSSEYPIYVVIPGPEDQGRLGVFFRILLALPALVLSGVMNYLVEIAVFFAWFVCLFTGKSRRTTRCARRATRA
ncbi:MAG TPA: DUF4389 domain-containing protein [Gaiellaceae bacterium]|nr:DUF4389 domain-containing protein [Gaiellaceae bacterium]